MTHFRWSGRELSVPLPLVLRLGTSSGQSEPWGSGSGGYPPYSETDQKRHHHCCVGRHRPRSHRSWCVRHCPCLVCQTTAAAPTWHRHKNERTRMGNRFIKWKLLCKSHVSTNDDLISKCNDILNFTKNQFWKLKPWVHISLKVKESIFARQKTAIIQYKT